MKRKKKNNGGEGQKQDGIGVGSHAVCGGKGKMHLGHFCYFYQNTPNKVTHAFQSLHTVQAIGSPFCLIEFWKKESWPTVHIS